MHHSLLVRLLPSARAGPRLAGVVEVVDTGELTPFRDADDLVAVLQRIQVAGAAETDRSSARPPARAPDRDP